MLKTLWLVKRGAGVSRADLFKHWEGTHIPHVRNLIRPWLYRVTFFEPGPDGAEPAYDGLAELWLRDRAHFDSFWGPNPPPTLGADGFQQLIDRAALKVLLADEHIIVPGPTPAGAAKLCAFLRRKDGVTQPALFEQWLRVHAPNVAGGLRRTPGALRYVVNTACAAGAPFDGCAEIYFTDAAAQRAGLQGVAEDGFGQCLDPQSLLMLVGREIVAV